MSVTTWPDAESFLRRAEAFLLGDEARHNLTLGLALALREAEAANQPGGERPFLATIAEDERVIATAVRLPLRPAILILSPSAETETAGAWPWLDDLAATVREVVPTLRGVQAPPAMARAFAAAWMRLGGPAGQVAMSLRLHRLDTVRPVPAPPGQLRRATLADLDLLYAWMSAMRDEAIPHDPPVERERLRQGLEQDDQASWRTLYLWEDPEGTPRTMCGSAGPTPHGIRITAVYTPPADRRRGYATAAIAELSRLLLAADRRFCFLYTDLANPTSNRLYAAIGYVPICDVDDIRFGEGGGEGRSR